MRVLALACSCEKVYISKNVMTETTRLLGALRMEWGRGGGEREGSGDDDAEGSGRDDAGGAGWC